MPGPDQWTESDFQKATSLLQSGRGSAQQRERLKAALSAYQGRTGNLGRVAVPGLPKVSRETRSAPKDPFASYDAESAEIGPAPEVELEPSEQFMGVEVRRNPRLGAVAETAVDSFSNGINFGMGDELAAVEGLNALGLDPSAVNHVSAGMRKRRQQARDQNPKTALAAETVGAVMSPASKALGAVGGALGRAPGFSKKAGRAYELGMEGAAQGAGAGAALGPDDQSTFENAAEGAGLGAAAGPLSAFLLEPIGGGLGRMASKRKALSGGLDSGDVGRLLDERGSSALRQLGDDMDTVGFGAQGSEGMLEQAEQIAAAARDEIQAIERSGAQGVAVDLTGAGDALYDQGARLIATRDPAAVRMGQTLLEHSDGILQNPGRSYGEAVELRRFLDDLAFDQDGQKNGAIAKQIRRAVGQVRHAIISAAEQESPELAERVLRANKAFETAERVRHSSAYQVGREVAGGQSLASPLVRAKNIAGQRANSVAAPTLRQLAAFTDISGAGLALPWLNQGEQ